MKDYSLSENLVVVFLSLLSVGGVLGVLTLARNWFIPEASFSFVVGVYFIMGLTGDSLYKREEEFMKVAAAYITNILVRLPMTVLGLWLIKISMGG